MAARALTTNEFIQKSIDKHGNKFSHTNTIYKNQKTKVAIVCDLHGTFETLPYNHLVGNGGCLKCQNIKNGIVHKKDVDFFMNKANSIYNNFYDYSLVNYEHSLKKVDIICPIHGIFKINPSNHINNKQGCSKCGLERRKKSSRKSVESFLSLIKDKPNFQNYDFSLIDHIENRNRSKIKCVCDKHGEYISTAVNIARSLFFGCGECKKENSRLDTDKFIEVAKNKHGNCYLYESSNYVKSHDDITITCPTHGDYTCKAYVHMAGGGVCPKCTPFVSSYELAISEFIRDIGISDLKTSVRNIKGIKEIDMLSESHKIGIEFNGLYWHSDLFKDKAYHLNKTNVLNDLGYRLIHVFEDEWLEKQNICKSIITNCFNKTPNKIYGRKCIIKEVSYSDSKTFLKLNHIQGNCVSKYRFGLYYNDQLISLMTFGKPRRNLGNRSNNQHEYELLRFCNKINTTVIGGASKLFKYFVKKYSPTNIISFCDRRYGSGNLYKILGFQFEYNTPPNYFYVKGNKKYNRFSFRKDVLVSRGCEKQKTEACIMKELGYNRIYDCGSMKFKWTGPLLSENKLFNYE